MSIEFTTNWKKSPDAAAGGVGDKAVMNEGDYPQATCK